MIATVIGELYLRRETLVREIVVYGGGCEPMYIAWELLKEHGYTIHRVEGVYAPPKGDEERKRQVIEFAASEFGALVETLTGKPVDEARLSFELARSNRLTDKLGRVLDLRVRNPYYLRSLATTLLIEGNSTYFGRPDEYEEVLDLLIEEMEASDIIPPPKGKVIPIAWVGHRGQEFGVYKAVDDAGGALFFNAPGVGHGRHWREDLPPLEAVGDFLTGGWARGNWAARFKTVENIVAKTGSKGIILYTYIGCSFGGFHNEIEREHFQKMGIPSLNLEGSFQVGAVHGQLLTRVRAFVEMLS
jgi:benzoyl-CoA reductase/2-hydroxyglutaryl-CoA dehydratase subunit BcrC/BadD/HgdB